MRLKAVTSKENAILKFLTNFNKIQDWSLNEKAAKRKVDQKA